MPSRYDHHILPPVGALIAHRGRLASCREAVLPELTAGRDVVGPHVGIERRAHERHAPGRGHRATQRRHAELERQGNRRLVDNGAVLVFPHDLAAHEIEAGDVAPRRCLAGQAELRQEGVEVDCEWRTRVGVEAPVRSLRRPVGTVLRQLVDECHVVWVGKGNAAHRVDRHATPVHDTEISGIDQSALQRRRGEWPLVAKFLEADPAKQLIEHGRAPHVGLPDMHRH